MARLSAPDDGFRDEAGIERMLADIRTESRYTQEYLGRDHLRREVMDALAAVPRHAFVPEYLKDDAYANRPLPIGYGQTISQPFIVALMTDLLGVDADSRVLEIGTGCGYQTAVLARLVREVFTIELVAPLGEAAGERLRRLGYANVITRIGDGHLGWPEHAPYDGIIVTAAASAVPPALIQQLAVGARLVIPVGPPGYQSLKVITRRAIGEPEVRSVLPVAFVPLRRGEEAR